MGANPHLTLRPYGATSTNNTVTARTGVSITHTALEGHQSRSGATTTRDTAILQMSAVKAVVHPLLHKVRAKAIRDLAVSGTGRARIFQQGTNLIKPHLHYTTSLRHNHLLPRGGMKVSLDRHVSTIKMRTIQRTALSKSTTTTKSQKKLTSIFWLSSKILTGKMSTF
jgi:hypothetical protein